MTFSKYLKFFILGFTFLGLFASCSKDSEALLDTTGTDARTENSITSSNDLGSVTTASNQDGDDCYTFVYPIDIAFSDGSTQSVDSDQALDDLLDAWEEANPNDTINYPVPVFPVIVVSTTDMTEQIINDLESLEALYAMCEELEDEDGEEEEGDYEDDEEGEEEEGDYEDDEEGEDYEDGEDCLDDIEDCFTFVYPIDLNLPDGSTITVDSDEALYEALDAWEDMEMEDSEAYPIPSFPVTVILPDGTEQVLNDEEALFDLMDACEGMEGEEDEDYEDEDEDDEDEDEDEDDEDEDEDDEDEDDDDGE